MVKIFISGRIQPKNAPKRDKKLLRVLGVTRKSWQRLGSYLSLSGGLANIYTLIVVSVRVLLTKTDRKSHSRHWLCLVRDKLYISILVCDYPWYRSIPVMIVLRNIKMLAI